MGGLRLDCRRMRLHALLLGLLCCPSGRRRLRWWLRPFFVLCFSPAAAAPLPAGHPPTGCRSGAPVQYTSVSLGMALIALAALLKRRKKAEGSLCISSS